MASNGAEQVWSITGMTLSAMKSRTASTAVSIAGIAGVVIVFVGLLSIAEGFRALTEMSGEEDVAVVMRTGATEEVNSQLELGQVLAANDLDMVARDAEGAVSSPELSVVADLPLGRDGAKINVAMRGVTPRAASFRDEFRIIKGRRAEPGTAEVIVGRALRDSFPALDVGREVAMGANRWQIVGVFADRGSLAESEMWADSSVVQTVFNRGTSVQTLRVKLQDRGALRAFRDKATSDPRINARVISERQLYRDQSRVLITVVTSVGIVIGLLMGLGAVFSALNTMYSAVSTRTREISTLRALGFGSGPIVTSVLAEAAVLGLVGGLFGALVAWFAFDGLRTSTLNFVTFSQMTFTFAVPPALLAQSIAYALLLGLIGGLLPSLRAARIPIATGLRGR